MVLLRCKISKNSERTNNKNNTQKRWIRKSLTEQMRFQMSLELQEINDKKGGTTLPGGRVSRQSLRVRGGCNPAKLLFWDIYFKYGLESILYVKNVIFFYKEKPGEILMLRTFLAKNSILAYISLCIVNLSKIGNYKIIVTPMMGCLNFFGMYRKRKPTPIPWCQISIPQAFIFQIHRGVATTPPCYDVLQK